MQTVISASAGTRRAYLACGTVAILIVSWSLYNVAIQGPGPVIPAFCVPVHGFTGEWCYPAEPFSLITLSVVMLLFVRRWGILAPVLTAVAAVSYDLIGGGIGVIWLNGYGQYTPFGVQLLVVTVPLFLLRKSIKYRLSPILLAYALVSSSGAALFMTPLGSFSEPIWISLYCFAFYDSVLAASPSRPPAPSIRAVVSTPAGLTV